MTQNELVALWRRAGKAKIGIRIKTDDRSLLRWQLYSARKESGSTEFEHLGITTSEKSPDEVWIVNKEAPCVKASRRAFGESNA